MFKFIIWTQQIISLMPKKFDIPSATYPTPKPDRDIH